MGKSLLENDKKNTLISQMTVEEFYFPSICAKDTRFSSHGRFLFSPFCNA